MTGISPSKQELLFRCCRRCTLILTFHCLALIQFHKNFSFWPFFLSLKGNANVRYFGRPSTENGFDFFNIYCNLASHGWKRELFNSQNSRTENIYLKWNQFYNRVSPVVRRKHYFQEVGGSNTFSGWLSAPFT